MPDDSRTLLDSDLIIDLARGYVPAIDLIDGLIAEGERPAVSVVSEMELLVGARTKSELRLIAHWCCRFLK